MNNSPMLNRTKPAMVVAGVLMLLLISLILADYSRSSLTVVRWATSLGLIFLAGVFLQPKVKSRISVFFQDPVDLDKPLLSKAAAGFKTRTYYKERCGSVLYNHLKGTCVLTLNGEEKQMSSPAYTHLTPDPSIREPVSLSAAALLIFSAVLLCPAFQLWLSKDDWIAVDLAVLALLVKSMIVILKENQGIRPPSEPVADFDGKLYLPQDKAVELITQGGVRLWPTVVGFLIAVALLVGHQAGSHSSEGIFAILLTGLSLVPFLGLVFAGLACGLTIFSCVPIAAWKFPWQVFLLLWVLISMRLLIASDFIEDRMSPSGGEPDDRPLWDRRAY